MACLVLRTPRTGLSNAALGWALLLFVSNFPFCLQHLSFCRFPSPSPAGCLLSTLSPGHAAFSLFVVTYAATRTSPNARFHRVVYAGACPPSYLAAGAVLASHGEPQPTRVFLLPFRGKQETALDPDTKTRSSSERWDHDFFLWATPLVVTSLGTFLCPGGHLHLPLADDGWVG